MGIFCESYIVGMDAAVVSTAYSRLWQGHMAESAELARKSRRAILEFSLRKAARKTSLHDGGIGRAGLALDREPARLLGDFLLSWKDTWPASPDTPPLPHIR